jgi:hypothetical protein
MAIPDRKHKIPEDVLRAAKKAGFNKPDIYSGRLEHRPDRAPIPGVGICFAVLLILAVVIWVLS